MHSRARVIRQGFWHEGCVHALLDGNFFDHCSKRHDVIGGSQSIGVAQVNFVLARARFVVAKLHRNAQIFEHTNSTPAEIVCASTRNIVEIPCMINRLGPLGAVFTGFEQIELNFGMGVESEAKIRGFFQLTLEHIARVHHSGLTIGGGDVTEHSRRGVNFSTPGQDLESCGVWVGQHICFKSPSEAFDRGTVNS